MYEKWIRTIRAKCIPRGYVVCERLLAPMYARAEIYMSIDSNRANDLTELMAENVYVCVWVYVI
jgi:hypothetical protein